MATGNNEKLTFCLNTNEDKSNKEITTIQSQELQITQATVLIESLLQQLCYTLVGDKVRRKKLYHGN